MPGKIGKTGKTGKSGNRYVDRDRRQAEEEAALRANPERLQLEQILGDLRGSAMSAERSARSGGRMMAASIKEATPGLDRIYGEAQTRTQGALANVGSDLGRLGPAASGLKGAVALEGLERGRLAGSLGQANRDFAARAPEAVAAGIQEARNVRSKYLQDKEKVLGRLQANAAEAGSFAATRYGQLRQDAADRSVSRGNSVRSTSQSERNSIRSSGVDPDTGKAIKGGRLDKKAKGKTLTPAQRNDAIDRITSARGTFRSYGGKVKADVLRSGLRVGELRDANNNALKLPKVKSDIEITAGMELAEHGHLTAKTYRELVRRKYRVPKSWREAKGYVAPNRTQGANDQRPASPTYGRG